MYTYKIHLDTSKASHKKHYLFIFVKLKTEYFKSTWSVIGYNLKIKVTVLNSCLVFRTI